MADVAALHTLAEAIRDPGRPVPPGLVARAGADPAGRLAVYRNNLATGLVEALRAGFPVTERIVGEVFFRFMARAFAAAHRPASPLLAEYGSAFPAFVAGFAPAAALPYLDGVAAVEAARTQAHHAADAASLNLAGLAERLADRIGDAVLAVRIRPHPATRLVTSRYPVASIWTAHQAPAAPRFDGPWLAEAALVTRPGFEVRVRALDAVGGRFASALLAGTSVAEAGARALEQDPAFDAGSVLVALTETGAIGDLEGLDE